MSPLSVSPCSDELYNQLVEIVSPNPTSPPKFQEIAILPSSSHPVIQYDPSCVPPAIGIPKALLLSCFIRARQVFFSHLEACRGKPPPVSKWEANAPSINKKWMEVYEATTVILLWEPNHLTAINWRKRVFTEDEEQGKIRQSELEFLNSLLTSPMPQHVKSSTLWAHRLQMLKKGEHDSGDAWRKELHVVMLAGERHAKNYHAWEHARQVWQLFSNVRKRDGSERYDDDQDWTGEKTGMFQESVSVVQSWCLKHPKDISGWAFLAFLLGSPRDETTRLQETTKAIEQTRNFVKKLNWTGVSVGWFLKTAEELEPKHRTRYLHGP